MPEVLSPRLSDTSHLTSITSTLVSLASQSSHSRSSVAADSSSNSDSDDSDDSQDSQDSSDESEGPPEDAQQLFLKAKLAARARDERATATATGDGLAGQEDVVAFGRDDPMATATRAAPLKALLHPASLNAPTALNLALPSSSSSSTSKRGITLAQDLAGLVEGDKWGRMPFKSLSKKEQRARHPKTAGPNWFDLPAPEVTPELKREIAAMRLRNSLDPKRFYRGGAKEGKALPEFFSVGHIVQSSQGASNATQSAAPRKRTFVEELVEDEQARAYTKRKTREVMERGMSGRKGKGRKR